MKLLPSNTTILIGAGLSLDSGLPDGAALVEQAFDLVANSAPILLNDSELLELRRAIGDLRLEILLERLVTEIPKDFLFRMFDSLRNARPNFNHLAVIALKPRSIVTTNQDLLLESAAEFLGLRCSVIHLHGRCDNKQSIITTISQYLVGLRSSVAAQFRESLDGKDVVVLGYSGRDRDVMPLLGEGTMKSITWLHHPGSKRSPELHRLKERLRGRITIIVKDANQWLKEQLHKALCSELESSESNLYVSPIGGRKISHRKVARLTLIEANFAIGKTLEHVGQYNVAFKFYLRLLKHMRKVAASPELNTRVHLAIGRVQAFQYHFDRAYKRFSSIARNDEIPIVQRCQALADCVFVLRNSSNYRDAQHTLDELEEILSTVPPTITFLKFKGEAASNRAGILRINGKAWESIKLYQKADKYFRHAHDVEGWIEASTWLADNFLTLGRFRDAGVYIKRAIEDSDAYGRYFSKAWSLFLRGELLGLRGNVTSGVKIIEQAYKFFREINNPQGQVYSLLYISDLVREKSLAEAEHALKHADKLLQVHKFAHAKGRFLLEKAELARAYGRSVDMRNYLTSLERHLKNKRPFSTPPYLLLAHSKLVAAEHAREINDPNAIALLQKVRDLYSNLEANYYVARIDVARWLISRTHPDRSELLAICKREDYGHEIKRLQNFTTGHYPLHFV